ncbi:hypothetical protein GE107_16580 [Cohnella sp. CFH 77786]|uniref:DUF1796 family putative cysteine peptidase n=1 Tax=Cohnella sp. CFH 77786 TaxID=2662265 RepID=UPI001C60D1A6|nr:DUF1796 family putative cysteine peptidase [Cohnella sp. CFH 77786]MBW5447672.1 hypothetical protein [Cohnella sp. CFH 77786]
MKLKELAGSYDLILSMGYNCQPAFQLRANQVRSFTGPVDWVITNSIPNLIQLLDNGFKDYMKLENLQIIGSIYGHYSAEDVATGTLSFHDFPVPADQSRRIDNYPEFRQQLDRRIERFYERARSSRKALYVRERASLPEAISLRQALMRLSGGDVYLLVLNDADGAPLHDADWDEPFIAAAGLPKEESEWTDAWKELLKGIALE